MTSAVATILLAFLERREHALYEEAEQLRKRIQKANEERETVRKQIAPLRDALNGYNRADSGTAMLAAERKLFKVIVEYENAAA